MGQIVKGRYFYTTYWVIGNKQPAELSDRSGRFSSVNYPGSYHTGTSTDRLPVPFPQNCLLSLDRTLSRKPWSWRHCDPWTPALVAAMERDSYLISLALPNSSLAPNPYAL
ncbi:unnamed protein product [Natator depressus]